MTDFREVRALTVRGDERMETARHRMATNHVHLLLVTDPAEIVIGVITLSDIEGERPLEIIHERRVSRNEISVEDVMTPANRIEVVKMEAVLHATVAQVAATLKAAGRRHAMIVDTDDAGQQTIRGLFTAWQLAKQLGVAYENHDITQGLLAFDLPLDEPPRRPMGTGD
jgi:CBS domain containing-hemolysin-like protein